jgi:hypothetical protein
MTVLAEALITTITTAARLEVVVVAARAQRAWLSLLTWGGATAVSGCPAALPALRFIARAAAVAAAQTTPAWARAAWAAAVLAQRAHLGLELAAKRTPDQAAAQVVALALALAQVPPAPAVLAL